MGVSESREGDGIYTRSNYTKFLCPGLRLFCGLGVGGMSPENTLCVGKRT